MHIVLLFTEHISTIVLVSVNTIGVCRSRRGNHMIRYIRKRRVTFGNQKDESGRNWGQTSFGDWEVYVQTVHQGTA